MIKIDYHFILSSSSSTYFNYTRADSKFHVTSSTFPITTPPVLGNSQQRSNESRSDRSRRPSSPNPLLSTLDTQRLSTLEQRHAPCFKVRLKSMRCFDSVATLFTVDCTISCFTRPAQSTQPEPPSPRSGSRARSASASPPAPRGQHQQPHRRQHSATPQQHSASLPAPRGQINAHNSTLTRLLLPHLFLLLSFTTHYYTTTLPTSRHTMSRPLPTSSATPPTSKPVWALAHPPLHTPSKPSPQTPSPNHHKPSNLIKKVEFIEDHNLLSVIQEVRRS